MSLLVVIIRLLTDVSFADLNPNRLAFATMSVSFSCVANLNAPVYMMKVFIEMIF